MLIIISLLALNQIAKIIYFIYKMCSKGFFIQSLQSPYRDYAYNQKMNINRVQKFQQQKSPPRGYQRQPHSINLQAKKRVFRATQVNQSSSNNRNNRIFKNIPPQEKQHIYQRRPFESKVQLGSNKNKQYLFQKHQQRISPKHAINPQINNFNFSKTAQQNPYNLPMASLHPKLSIQNTKSRKQVYNGKIPFRNNNQLPKQKQILNSERIIISNISDRLIPKQDVIRYNGVMQKNQNQDSTVTIPRNYKKFLSQPSMPQSPKTIIPNSAHFINPFQIIQTNQKPSHIQFVSQSRGSNLFNSQTKKIKHKKIGLSKEGSQIKQQLSSLNRPTSRSKILGQAHNKKFIKLSKSLPMKITQMYESSDFRKKSEEDEESNKLINKLHIMKNRQNQYEDQYYQGAQNYKQQRQYYEHYGVVNKKIMEDLPSQSYSNHNIGTTSILNSANQIRLAPRIIRNQQARGSKIFKEVPSTVVQNSIIHHSPQQLKNVIKFNEYSPSKIQSPKNNSQIQQEIHSKVSSVIIKNQPVVNIRPQSVQIRPSSSIISSRMANPVIHPSQMVTLVQSQNKVLSPQHSSFHVSSARLSPGQTIIAPNQVIIQQNQSNNNIRRPHSSYEGASLNSRQFQPMANRYVNQNYNTNQNMHSNHNDIVLLRDSQNKNPSIILHQPNRNQTYKNEQNDDLSQNGLQSESRSINQSQQSQNENDGYQQIHYKYNQRQKQRQRQQYQHQHEHQHQQDPLPLQSKPTSPIMEFSPQIYQNQKQYHKNLNNLSSQNNHAINNSYNPNTQIKNISQSLPQNNSNFNSLKHQHQYQQSFVGNNNQFMINNNKKNQQQMNHLNVNQMSYNHQTTRMVNNSQPQGIGYNQINRPANSFNSTNNNNNHANVNASLNQNIRPFVNSNPQIIRQSHSQSQQSSYQINPVSIVPNNNSGWLSINRDKYSISEYCVIKKDNINANNNNNNNNVIPVNVGVGLGPQGQNINIIQQNKVFVPSYPTSNSFHIHNTNNSTKNSQNSNDKRKQSPINIIHSSSAQSQSPYYTRNNHNNPIIQQNSIQSQESQGQDQFKYRNHRKNQTNAREKQQYGLPTEAYHQKYRQYYNANHYYKDNQVNGINNTTTYNGVTNAHLNTNNTTTNYQGNYYANESSQVVPLDYSKSFIRSNNLNQSSQNSIKDHFYSKKYHKTNKVLEDQSELKQSIFQNHLLPSSNSLAEKEQGYYHVESKVLQRMNYNIDSNSKKSQQRKQYIHKQSQYGNVEPGLYSYKKIGSSSNSKYQQQKYSYCQ